MAPFRRVVRVAKPIVKARKPQSCALFSSQILRFSFPQHILCTQRVTSPLPDSAFQFPTFSITFTKPNLTTSRPTSPVTRAQKPRFCAREARKRGFQTLKAHKNLDFVREKPENGGSRPQKRTKTSILCSKCPKTRVPDPKSAQKPRFCARKARKRGFQTPKAHKNLDFVLEMLENGGYKPQKRTKNPILCSGR